MYRHRIISVLYKMSPSNDFNEKLREKCSWYTWLKLQADLDLFEFPMGDLANLKNKLSSLTWKVAARKNKSGWKLFICDVRLDVSDWLFEPASSGRSWSLALAWFCQGWWQHAVQVGAQKLWPVCRARHRWPVLISSVKQKCTVCVCVLAVHF